MNKLTKKILENGIENVYFIDKVKPLRTMLFVSYTSSSDPDVDMLCKIDETKYKVQDNYKIELKPMYDGFAKEEYYISDLQSLINKGHIKLLINSSVSV